MKKILNLQGLDCAACAAELEEILGKTAGVISASVSFVMQKIVLEYEDEAALQRAIQTANGFEEVRVLPEEDDLNDEIAVGESSDDNAKTLMRLEGLHCAACAATLERCISAIDGVKNVSVDFVRQRVILSVNDAEALKKAVKTANGFEKVRVLNAEELLTAWNNTAKINGETNGEANENAKQPVKNVVTNRQNKEAASILVSAVLFLAGILFGKIVTITAARALSYLFYATAYVISGWRVLSATAKNIVKGRIFDENFLMTIASVGAVILGDFAEGVAVMLLYTLGEWLQAVAVGSSRRNVADLMALKSESANLIQKSGSAVTDPEKTVSVPPERLSVGDEVIVRAGEKIPCDGVLVSPAASIDTKSLTGEAEYRALKSGDELLSGCINAGEVIRMRITKEYKNSAVKRILDLMENSAAQKAQSEKFITKFSRYYTPIVCIAALLVAFVFPLYDVFFGGGYTQNFTRWVRAALNFLVISCPCALIISVPLTYFCALGACAKDGVLVKGSTYLDALAKAKIVAFDKTGTLTKGNFSVTDIHAAAPFTQAEVLLFVKEAENNSAHPIARAFYSAGAADVVTESGEGGEQGTRKDESGLQTLFAREIAGKGVSATLQSAEGNIFEVLCGNADFLTEQGVTVQRIQSPRTTVYVSVNGAFAGSVEIGDSLRETAKAAILDLKKTGAEKTVILTGDTAERAQSVAREAGIDEWKAGLLPDEKLAAANELKARGALLYVGDGINDAPVMAAADCSASMGKLGAAAAVEASDVVLISDDLYSLAKGRRTAQKAQKIVKENIAFSIFCKAAFLIGSLAGFVQLWLAVFADVGVMMLAVLNALRMMRRDRTKQTGK